MNEELKKILAKLAADGGQLERTATLMPVITNPERAEGEDADYRFELSFSSEDPYERWFGMEILGHKKSEVRLDWLKGGTAPLLLNHNRNDLIGVVESAKLEDRRGKAVVRFGKSELAQEIRQDVIDGIRTNVSVGYRVHEMKLEKSGDKEPDSYRVTDWEPLEISSVCLPADRTVGTDDSRKSDDGTNLNPKPKLKETTMTPEELKAEAVRLGLSPDASLKAILAEQRKQAEAEGQKKSDEAHSKETQRCDTIRAMGKEHGLETEAQAAIDSKKSVDAFQADVLKKYSTGHQPVAPQAPAKSKQDQRDLSGFRVLKAIDQFGRGALDGVELEMHQEGLKEARELGHSVKGLALPELILHHRDLTVATEGTDLVQETVMGGSFIDILRSKFVLREMGATILTGNTGNFKIPKQTAGATVSWEGENDANDEQTATVGQVAFSPNRVGCFTDLSKGLIIQSSVDMEMFARNDLMLALASGIELAAIAGDGTGNQPTGIINTSGIGSVVGGTNGLAPTDDHIIDLETAVAIDNADIGKLGYLVNAKTRGKLKKTRVESGQTAKVWDRSTPEAPLNGYKAAVTNFVPSNLDKGTSTGVCSPIIFGNFADLIIAQWGGIDLVIDPLTQAIYDLTRIVINTRADVKLRRSESFAAMLDALTA